MFKIELRQEPMNGDFVLTNNNGNEIKFSISPENMDETEKLENFLVDFLLKKNQFPIYLHFYGGLNLLNDLSMNVDYQVVCNFDLLDRQWGIYKTEINTPESLVKVINETYSLATWIDPFIISDSPKVKFSIYKEVNTNIITELDMSNSNLYINVGHDANYLEFITNDERYLSVTSLSSHLPDHVQISKILWSK
ncbi:hypothetical protein [Bacillus kexueae]|uniref:hypothetical protein n=1 Tax=Aeribacillus kexueae TaxID=2078952 RepID=UPI001FB01D36|nr:hypothetical protein [Bacillus kexueae]